MDPEQNPPLPQFNSSIPNSNQTPTPTPIPIPTPSPVSTAIPIPKPTPAQEPVAWTPPTNLPPQIQIPVPSKNGSHLKGLLIPLLAVLFIGGGTVFAYVQKIGPFSYPKYDEANFLSSIESKMAEINSASYSASFALDVSPRDKDAKPFELKKVSNSAKLEKDYFYDYQRVTDASSIISELNYKANYYSGYSSTKTKILPYPTSIKSLTAKKPTSRYSAKISINDPETKQEYEYTVTEGGSNFKLKINFSTDYAISSLKKYGYISKDTIIDGKQVTFTKNSSTYMYLSRTPPKPFLVEMSDSLKFLPPEMNAKGTFSVSSSKKSKDETDWLANVDAVGNFGDLNYKVNIEATKVGKEYYFRINNLPSLFLFGDIGAYKNKWINITSKVATSTEKGSYSSLSYLKDSIPASEKKYKESREKYIKFVTEVLKLADSEKVVYFKSSPSNEKIESRNLTRYELGIKKDKILPFYEKLASLINNNPDYKEYQDIIDQGTIDYLKSDEFSQVFDYLDKNDTLVIWTDSSGFPAGGQMVTRIVPPDTATQLKDKQIVLTGRLIIDNINKNLNISAPADSVSIDKITSETSKNLYQSNSSKTSIIQSYMYGVYSNALYVYDDKNSYGNKPFPLGECKATADTLFADKNVFGSLEKLKGYTDKPATCISKGTTGKVTSYAVSVPLPDSENMSWCVDSSGDNTQIIGSIKSDSCR